MKADHGKECGSKVPHQSREAAGGQLAAMVKKLGVNPAMMNVYRCRFCRSWHVGHRVRSNNRRWAHGKGQR